MGEKKDEYGWWLTRDGICGSCTHFETRGAGLGWCRKGGKGSWNSTSAVWARDCWQPDLELKAQQREEIESYRARQAEAERRYEARRDEVERVRAERQAAAAIRRLERVDRKNTARAERALRKQEKAERKATRRAGK